MGGETKALSGPDLEKGVPYSEFRDGVALLGHAHGNAVLLVKEGETLYAIGASCTYYGGLLSEGLVIGGTVRCPWHHARFDLRTGAAVGAPALSPIPCYAVLREGPLVKLGAERKAPAQSAAQGAPSSVVIVGAGVAGAVCAETLRREGYSGSISVVGAEAPGPVDRSNLSKDYLAGNAPEEWIPLRTVEASVEQNIDLIVDDPVQSIDTAEKSVRLCSDRMLKYGALVLVIGAVPVCLSIEGATLSHVYLLRMLVDSRAIIVALGSAKCVVVIGVSFIGFEVVASLCQCGLEVMVVGCETVPFECVLGPEVGRFVQGVHESKGVSFRFGETFVRIIENAVEL